MLSFFRRVSSSAIGKVVAVIFFLAILASFAAGDISNFGSGNIGLGMSSSTLVKVGGEGVTEPEMSDAMQKHLQDVRQQNPQADYADIAGDFDAILAQLVDQKAVIAFADKYGFPISKRLVDADIAQIPGVKGLDGKVSVQGYQQFLSRARLSDAQVREIISAQVTARNLLLPISIHEEAKHRLIGRNSGRVYRLADRVTVKLLEADGMTGSTVFQLVSDTGEELPNQRRPARFKGRRRG